jgi:hypothetical protein
LWTVAEEVLSGLGEKRPPRSPYLLPKREVRVLTLLDSVLL